ncbi:hypothetical protein CPAST_c01550 [Clostridium pasteurianum DSM 525 = ATCC 6013]|uniref:Anti-sigma factor RsgI-like middle domain-containing protein n=1 Tax=Clostridium pasteurianum DSM 525 = ATCC 6013 TaxID=1262449 RepID=A0A0H3J5P5_CLOPA|nr:hypothetical protein [Clostridium pasteurianum]AJA46255.1 hypothetical protein CPAST_c01550 [Clostridium pasteurianum DSM 525 = ATCC 6013]AJA50243.1 hypothetical protein CLPA_c01550 [Clostridium pasteurianum DSM 525 = ATCC 6013]AOZ73708.1 hypothetical protein AQ983_00760 [Clostridium pasteurianum DSM 525 = ATCC 6013]AOZ77505.1 hypothetical protein AQ984_00760 [Clostridium pasteurianum]ELP60839.1 hypothetical protein F502_00220 [Clostridium pasteurianum DSM 525 = ATCC 6013]
MNKVNDSQTINLEEFKTQKNASSNKFIKIKRPMAVLSILIIFTIIITYYIYSYTTSLVIVNAGISINLKVNRWNKVIDVSSTNSSGDAIISHNNIKHKNINDALLIILGKAEANNYVNPVDDTNESKKKISILISGNSLDISNFSNIVKEKKFDLTINENGREKK